MCCVDYRGTDRWTVRGLIPETSGTRQTSSTRARMHARMHMTTRHRPARRSERATDLANATRTFFFSRASNAPLETS